MIKIIFFGGLHGNYLEFVLNKTLYGNQIERTSPLGRSLGTSHDQRSDENYQKHRFFVCHEVHDFIKRKIDPNERYVLIDADANDNITAVQLNLKRGEDHNIDPDTLTDNTFHKLFGKFGHVGTEGPSPNKIIDCINQFTDLTPYYNIKDPSWPNIHSVDDFYNLPKDIITECRNIFGFTPIHISPEKPDAPRWVLRSIFKSWFSKSEFFPSTMMQRYYDLPNCYRINFRNLYNWDSLVEEIHSIGKFLNLQLDSNHYQKNVHAQFIDQVPYKNSRYVCESILEAIRQNKSLPIRLNVIEEGYINFLIEKEFDVIMPEERNEYFTDTTEIVKYLQG